MTSPVRNNQQPVATQSPPAPQPPAPGGVGNAPTQMESMGAQQEPKGLGYIERGVQWLWSWITWGFKKVFFCFFKQEPELDNRPVPPQVHPPQLMAELQMEVDYLEAFSRLTDMQRNVIYRRVGERNSSRWNPLHWIANYEAIGEAKIRSNPEIIRDYLILR